MAVKLTYGAELEWSDYDRSIPLPEGNLLDDEDYTVVNSNGICADPLGVITRHGGEINTLPTETLDDQVANFDHLVRLLEPRINYRSNQHIHIGLPEEIRLDLFRLKRFWSAVFMHHLMFMRTVDVMPDWSTWSTKDGQARAKHSLQSHQRQIPAARFKAMMEAQTMEEFKNAIAPPSKKDGKPCWQLYARWGINPKPLWEHGTVEFRCFFGTLNTLTFRKYLQACDAFMRFALEDARAPNMVDICKKYYAISQAPSEFDPFLEWGWSKTSRAKVTEKQAIINAERILTEGRWEW